VRYHRRMPAPAPYEEIGSLGNARLDEPLLLASQSPRRRRLLEWLGLPFAVTAVETPELLDSPLAANPPALAASLAAEKAVAVRAQGLASDALVLCFDTIVVHDGRVLGKPRDVDDAWRMLRSLSGRTHEVVTGVALLAPDSDEPQTFAVTTNVAMLTLCDTDIEAWMAHETFLGCAGAYNIEAQVAEVTADECYQNVAGLPLCHLYAALTSDDALAASLPSTPCVPVAPCDSALGRKCRLGPLIVSR
jgi:nucleoside triphosphate pyrophosphatase